jgi:hypothetical protein
MKVRMPVHATLLKRQKGDYVVLKTTCKKDNELLLRFFHTKTEREKRNQKEFFVQALLDLPHQKRTFKQNSSVWKLITIIYESMEGRLPTEEEKYGLYLDLLELYADKIPNRINGTLRPVHISESNSAEGARFIDALLWHLASMCNLDYNAQTEVIDILYEWEAWRVALELDPADYSDLDCTTQLTMPNYRVILKHAVRLRKTQTGNLS